VSGLRPTPDRVRETLFNWLQSCISGANCLDLYAGTGALGFEALSRGAASVVMVERNKDLAIHLDHEAKKLGAAHIEIVCMDVSAWLKGPHQPFDIVFLDPPYAGKQAGNNLGQLINCGCLKGGTLVYVETDYELTGLDRRLREIKSSRAGAVLYRLLRFEQE
jgi:16S rRNA (guanine966-N2)-methyltransferase